MGLTGGFSFRENEATFPRSVSHVRMINMGVRVVCHSCMLVIRNDGVVEIRAYIELTDRHSVIPRSRRSYWKEAHSEITFV